MSVTYCEVNPIKNRLLISLSDTSMDEDIEAAIEEASRIVDIFMKPYAESLPLDYTDLTDQIEIITADFSASIFKRRWNPSESTTRGNLQPDMINDVDGSGWFAVALRRMQDYIKSFYTLQTQVGSVTNPEVYRDLMKMGVITPKEARDLMVDDQAFVTKKIAEVLTRDIQTNEEINKTLMDNQTINKDSTLTKEQTDTEHLNRDQTIDTTRTEDDTKTIYHTKKQNSFVFVRGKAPFGIVDEGYEDDSEDVTP